MIQRRSWITACGVSLAPLAGWAQQARQIYRIGMLGVGFNAAEMAGHQPTASPVAALLAGLRELGYLYGEHFVTEPRSPVGQTERFPALVAELIDLRVDVIVAAGPALAAIKQATSTVPIVMAGAEDPVGLGVVKTLAHPGTNFTGLSNQAVEAELGWIEGQNVAYDRVYADDRHRELPRLAAELVSRKPELIYAPPQIAAMAARQATRTIPIVFATGTDPVGAGLASSLAHPGGNVTGVVSVIDSLAPKRLELLREILPSAKRIGLLGDPNDPRLNIERSALASVATALGLKIIVAEASNPAQLDAAVGQLVGQGVNVILGTTSISINLRGRLIELANRGRLPVVGGIAAMAQAGALFAYGAPLADQLRRSAQLVDKVLKGASPADLPIEQPTRFELIINLKAARALGLTVPQPLLLRADEVIQ